MADRDSDLDVAISFANEDLGFAADLRDRLGDSLSVFLYTKKQEDLAGTDGLKSFREVFRYRARLVVILLREKWGKTPWTRVEEEAITDRFLKEGPAFLFVVLMDDSAPPPWLPDKLIRFNLIDFGVEQAVGAIKARALERGSVVQRPSVAFLAARTQEIAEFEKRRANLQRSEEGVSQVQQEAQSLVSVVNERIADVKKAAPILNVEYGAEPNWFVIKTRGVAIHGSYLNRIINVLDEARFVVRELRGGVLLPGQAGYYIQQPRELAVTTFRPELTRARGWCWKSPDAEVKTSEEVAEFCVARFLALVELDAAGNLPNEW